jgi:hypothetical protein
MRLPSAFGAGSKPCSFVPFWGFRRQNGTKEVFRGMQKQESYAMILMRRDIRTQLQMRLAHRVSAEQLANWAVDRFYALEQGTLTVDEHDQALFRTILDDLMFADSPGFALDDTDLQRLVARLDEL